MGKKNYSKMFTEDKDNKETTKRVFTGVVTADLLNVRSQADIDSEIVRTVSKGDELEIEYESRGFYRIEDGYCKKDFVEVK